MIFPLLVLLAPRVGRCHTFVSYWYTLTIDSKYLWWRRGRRKSLRSAHSIYLFFLPWLDYDDGDTKQVDTVVGGTFNGVREHSST